MISSAVIVMPSSARQAASARQAIVSLSTRTPSQSKITSSVRIGTAPPSYSCLSHSFARLQSQSAFPKLPDCRAPETENSDDRDDRAEQVRDKAVPGSLEQPRS